MTQKDSPLGPRVHIDFHHNRLRICQYSARLFPMCSELYVKLDCLYNTDVNEDFYIISK